MTKGRAVGRRSIVRRKRKPKKYNERLNHWLKKKPGKGAKDMRISKIKSIPGEVITDFAFVKPGEQFYVLKYIYDRQGHPYFGRRDTNGVFQYSIYKRLAPTQKSTMTGFQYNAEVAMSKRPTKGYFIRRTKVVKIDPERLEGNFMKPKSEFLELPFIE